MTGFNRRFAPAIARVCEAVRARSAPLMINYRMNAGYMPATHWVHGPEGGGRNIGEALPHLRPVPGAHRSELDRVQRAEHSSAGWSVPGRRQFCRHRQLH